MPHEPPDPDLPNHLDAALAALSPTDRELLIRRYFQNHPIADIAAALHLSDNTLSKRLARALEKLRHHLARRGITAPAATLTATLLSTAIRPAPTALAAHILTNAALTPATPFGVLLMTTPTKLLAFLTALLLLASTFTTIVLSRPHPLPKPTQPEVPIALPTPVLTPATQNTDAQALLDKCQNALNAVDVSDYSFQTITRFSGITGKPFPEASIRIGHVRRDDNHRWLVEYADWDGSLSTPPDQRKGQRFVVSYGDDLLVLQPDRPVLGGYSNLTLWPKSRLRIIATQSQAMALEGYFLCDQTRGGITVDEATLIFDVMRNASPSATTVSKTVTITATGKCGLYEIDLDPANAFLPSRIEITKQNGDLFYGKAVSDTTGTDEMRFLPDSQLIQFHLLLDHVHIVALDNHPVIDSASMIEKRKYADGSLVTYTHDLHRTDIHLNPQFKDSDFNLPVPEGTRVSVISRRTRDPLLELRNNKVVRSKDGQPPAPKEKAPTEN